MELRQYLRIIARRWWLVAIAFVITTTATLALVLPQPPVYESSGTMLLRPRAAGVEDQAVDATDLLIRGVKIAATYATIAQSDMILERAQDQLGPGVDASEVSISAEVLTDTNVMAVTAQGPDPEVAHAMADAVALQTIAYVDELEDAYVLSTLDPPSVSRNPVGPNKALTIAVGNFFGLMLGIGLALLAHYLKGTSDPRASVIDPVTQAYDARFFARRLREEISRADRTEKRGFSVVTMTVAFRAGEGEDGPVLVPAASDLVRIAAILDLTGREETVIAHLGDGEFAGLLPDVSADETSKAVLVWKTGVTSAFLAGSRRGRLLLSIGACEYRDRRLSGQQDATQTVEWLLAMDQADGNGRRPSVRTDQDAQPAPRPAPAKKAAPAARRSAASPEGNGKAEPQEAVDAADGNGARPSSAAWKRRSRTRAGTRRR